MYYFWKKGINSQNTQQRYKDKGKTYEHKAHKEHKAQR